MPSRIAGRGSLVRTLRTLRGRVRRYAEGRAATLEEQSWAGTLHDELGRALDQALDSPGARASERAVEARRRRGRKRTPQQWTEGELDGL